MPSTLHARAFGRAYAADCAPDPASPCTACMDSFRASTLERLQDAKTELPRRSDETQTGVDGADVVLIREIGPVQRRDHVAMSPGDLRIDDVARLDTIAARFVLKERRPLLGHVAVVDPGRDGIAARQREHVLHADVERQVRRVRLIAPLEIDARWARRPGCGIACAETRASRVNREEASKRASHPAQAGIDGERTEHRFELRLETVDFGRIRVVELESEYGDVGVADGDLEILVLVVEGVDLRAQIAAEPTRFPADLVVRDLLRVERIRQP